MSADKKRKREEHKDVLSEVQDRIIHGKTTGKDYDELLKQLYSSSYRAAPHFSMAPVQRFGSEKSMLRQLIDEAAAVLEGNEDNDDEDEEEEGDEEEEDEDASEAEEEEDEQPPPHKQTENPAQVESDRDMSTAQDEDDDIENQLPHVDMSPPPTNDVVV